MFMNLISGFQFSYTTLFGAYSAFLFAKTGMCNSDLLRFSQMEIRQRHVWRSNFSLNLLGGGTNFM
jgi:hypothetical protein